MSWRESGGPPVKPPVFRGFGSTVITTSIEQSLGAEVGASYHPAGFRWRMVAPAAQVLEE